MKNKKRPLGPVVEIILMGIIISLISLVCNLLGVSGYITDSSTFETTMITVQNILSKKGIKYILEDSLVNFRNLEPLVMIIMSLIAVSIMEASGFLKQLFNIFTKIKPKYVTFIVFFVGIISTILGDYSYALLLPLSGILYKYIHKDSSLGILTMFVAITVGYGIGIIANYQSYELGLLTQTAAQDITQNYKYILSSNIYFMLISTAIISLLGTVMIENIGKKYPRNEEIDNLNISKKARNITLVAFIVMVITFAYCIIPGLPFSGMLLKDDEAIYVAKLFAPGAPLKDGLMFIIIGVLMVCGFIYGTVSRNIKNSSDYSNALTVSFKDTGYIFVLLFFMSLLYGIINYTKIDQVIITNIINFIGTSNFNGLILVITSFISILIMTILMPNTLTKWNLIAPVYIPLLMRANITPSFTQSIFLAADSAGKLFSPIYIYLIVTIGFIYKYRKDDTTSIFQTMKRIMPVALVLTLIWFVIVIGWYLTGLPIGINTSVTL